MKFLLLLCSAFIICVDGGLIKNLFGAVTDEVHKLTDGNIVKNVVHTLATETKGVIEDVGDLLHVRKNKKPHVQQEDRNKENYINQVTTIKAVINTENNKKSDNDASVEYNYGEGVISPRMGDQF